MPNEAEIGVLLGGDYGHKNGGHRPNRRKTGRACNDVNGEKGLMSEVSRIERYALHVSDIENV